MLRIECGETVPEAQRRSTGTTINAAMMAVLAAFGYAEVTVGQQPRAGVLATGTELVSVDEKPGQDQIRDSNNYSIAAYAQLTGATVERLPLARDETSVLKNQIAEAAERCDVVITSGGVSMGVYDVTKSALQELNAAIKKQERINRRTAADPNWIRKRTPGATLSPASTASLTTWW